MADGRFAPFSADGAAVAPGLRDQMKVLPERIEPVRLPKSYFLSSLFALGGLFSLTAGYLALPLLLVGGFAFAIYAALTGHWMKDAGDYKLFLALVILAGGVVSSLVFFMMRPLFERRGLEPQPLKITERDQSLFFAFLERLCRAINAPMPDEVAIDCQPNAAVRRLGSIWGKERLQLVIGTPFIHSFSASQLAGVIAHELAHFRQRGGRRLSYFIGAMQAFLERLAFVRTRHDRKLEAKFREEKEESNLFGILLYGGGLSLIWLARRLCRGLAWLGAVISGHHSRQLEYDADRWEARLVGKDRFAGLMREIALLDVACQQAMAGIAEHREEGRFPIDLAEYGLAFRGGLAQEDAEAIWKAFLELDTGLKDSHPCHRDRIANVEKFEHSLPPDLDLPAAELFREWMGLSRLATRVQYCIALGEAVRPEELVRTEELLGKLAQNSEADEAHIRYFGGAWPWLRPLRLGAMLDYIAAEVAKGLAADPAADLQPAALRQILAQRDLLLRESPRVKESRTQFWNGVERLVEARAAEQLREAGAADELRRLGWPGDPRQNLQEQQAAVQEIRQSDQALGSFEGALVLRLALALAGPGGGRLEELRRRAAPLITFLRALEPQVERLRGIVIENAMLRAVGNLGEEYPLSEAFRAQRRSLAGGLLNRLKQIYFDFETIPHPLAEPEKGISAAGWLLAIPEANQDSILESAGVLTDNLPSAVFRTLGLLAQIAEEIEKELGLPPLLLFPEDFS